ncbi:hypothetical protein E2P81_ATG01509 [Venturia nashicola]|uniref:Uncharacterized protein n=1 Tax=Venturia nashicola TaxID=86259 RepID=A0A4Z1PH89_9PEZI|nr:hypothetical protein E6O75_ATG01547 [Venturia nashicola]TLD38966.1 hypothetical protein E2P81_ATG01509 [Venturia nashicola]
MAPWLSNEILTQVSTAVDPLAVQDYGGDTILRLSERPEDHLLMNSESLKKCSNWFQPRGEWDLYGDSGPANTLTAFDPLTNEYFPIYNYYMSVFIEEEHGLWLLHSDMGPLSSGLAPCMAICFDGEERSRKCTYSGPIIDTEMTTNFVEEKLESRLLKLLEEAKFLVETAIGQASYDLSVGRSKKPVRGEVEFWTNCLLDESDVPWNGHGQKYTPVILKEEVTAPFRKDWGDVVGVDVMKEMEVRWLFQQLTLGVGIFDT